MARVKLSMLCMLETLVDATGVAMEAMTLVVADFTIGGGHLGGRCEQVRHLPRLPPRPRLISRRKPGATPKVGGRIPLG